MALTSCFCHSSASFKIEPLRTSSKYWYFDGMSQSLAVSVKNSSSKFFGRQVLTIGADLHGDWSFVGGSKVYFRRTKFEQFVPYPKRPAVLASWLPNSQIASSVFSLGTVTVLPFYTLMVLAPRAELTKKSIESHIPYVVLGLLYAYLLYLSWTPETVRLIFASKYWLPELPGIAKMFSSEMTLASAWIHLLVVDLFAARQIFHDGQQNKIETRHSVSLCLLFCPIGILTHILTKALTKLSNKQTM